MKAKVYKQKICTDCLLMLVNGESDHSEEELKRMDKTLEEWAKDGYTPAGMATDKNGNCEPSFSWRRCDLCGQIAGDRYEYNFIQK